MKIILITGPPYCGKGTQAKIIEGQFGFRHISTGDAVRAEKQSGSDLGLTMASFSERGELVPDEIMKDLFAKVLDKNRTEEGILLDGYPRTRLQVDHLLELTEARNLSIRSVINIEVPKEELLVRAKQRAEGSDRPDDKDRNTHLRRIEIFEQQTKPCIDYLQNQALVLSLSGIGNVEQVSKRIAACLP